MASPTDETARARTRSAAKKGPLRLLARTLSKAWEGSIFSEAAEAAFWQTLSFPPLLLGLLGSMGYLGDWLGPEVVSAVKDRIISFCRTIFSGDVVNDVIAPTVDQILTTGKGEIVSIGFLISLWAGSSAMSSFVDAITAAHDQYGVRNEVWQRIFALLLYVASLVLLIVGLPVLALGPDLLLLVFPTGWRPTIEVWLSAFYYPGIAVLLVLALTSLYKLSLPNKLPWHRLIPGAALAMTVFLLSSIGLRLYIQWITTTGYTYGALATPIAFLLFAFFIGLAITIGAYFNSAVQEMWPARMTRRQRRRWRRLELERAAERIRSDEGKAAWSRADAASAGGEEGENGDGQRRGTGEDGDDEGKGVTDDVGPAPSPADTAETRPLRIDRSS
ncbi:membrane protein [Saccharothrix tamanrassetensis]|uniref:Membrane protein n=2 Tax=Saccharothrix tamanrassetensis TaxID=1051531 RepID=A0A841CQP5_9PSEU|nr:YihY/virulence factor BrkB family protein [Saccharothrix tamanrassetensis]MBB5960041.1 membrane protein [Saccharothrix tamanrassetensis]